MKKVNDIYRNLPIPFFFLYPSNFLSPILSFTLSSFIVILDFWKFWIFRLYWGVFLLFYFFQHFSFLFLFFSIAKENCSWPYYFFFLEFSTPNPWPKLAPISPPPPSLMYLSEQRINFYLFIQLWPWLVLKVKVYFQYSYVYLFI